MTPDDLRALADALEPMARAPRFEDFDVPAFCAWVRACADAQPVAWMHDEFASTRYETVQYDEMLNRRCGFRAKPIIPLYTHPASAAPQADQSVRDLLAIIHRDDGHHTEAVGLDQSTKDAQAAVCELKRELAMGKREPRPCTCHPDDNPPVPCAQKYALSECRPEPTEAQIVAVADVLLAWEAEISNRVSARVLAEDAIRAALAAKDEK